MRWSWKKAILLFLVIFLCVTETGCSAVHSSEEKKDYPSQKVLLFRLYENCAWGYQQTVSVVGLNGHIYRVPEQYLPSDRSIFFQDDWYEQLVKVTENEESVGHISKSSLKLLCRLYRKLDEYIIAPYKEYESGAHDSGSVSLYLIFFDENGLAQKIKLHSYGDWIEYIDDKDIKRFVNRMRRCGFY